MKIVYNKLVRDKIAEYLTTKGVQAKTRPVSSSVILPMLFAKLTEEAQEATEATPERLPEELADILEVVEEIAVRSNIPWEKILELKRKKFEERGGFKDGVFLISTTEPDKPTK